MEFAEYYNSLREFEYYNYQIDYVLSETNNHQNSHCYAHSINDPEQMIELSFTEDNITVNQVADWDFNVDDYLFNDLENGKDIKYMSIDTHYNIWCAVDQAREDINHFDGLQKYLSYCQQNDITSITIKNLGLEPVDISDLYHEMNGNYEIIATLRSCHSVFVLGENNKAPSPYVTWITTDNRSRGYRSGHYFNDIEDALKDLKQRAIAEMKIESNYQRAFFVERQRDNSKSR